MALKAGYIGIKKSMLGFINNLAGAKIIKTIGDGLLLSDDGTLSTDGTGVINYSTEEQDTGIKWIDGKKIYQKTYNIGNATGTRQLIDTLGSDFSDIIDCYGSWNYQLSTQNEYRPIPHFASSTTMVYPIIDRADNNKLYMIVATAANTKDMKLTILYTKIETNSQKRRKK